ncbi:ribosomal-protein-alanine N-acetyltransferase [Acetobacteraceae bacterium]|nr:ribosomal-protein-alanine N-acetyltransferase [Acetobacteraceae bacterium]
MILKSEVEKEKRIMRPICMAHVPLLALIDEKCFASDLCWSADLFRSVLETGGWGEFLMLAEMPIGFYLCRSVAGETEILTLGILPEFQGKGLGKYLMESLFKGAKSYKAEEIFLEVEESNFAARRLYQNSGFKILGRRADYYGKGRDAFVMGFRPVWPE